MASKFRHAQLGLPIQRPKQPDRNLHLGGRSFYFFDFDDNVMYLGSKIVLFESTCGRERQVTTGEFARISRQVGKEGQWAPFRIEPDDRLGSFRRFRDHPEGHPSRGAEQPFIEDLRWAIQQEPTQWKGPSWELFEHAVHNQRGISIITARGHHPDTIAQGMEILYDEKHLTERPTFVSIFPVTHPPTREILKGCNILDVPDLKKNAIIRSVEICFERFGQNPYHRFGMSDDDPHNVKLSINAMKILKAHYPDNAFFVFDTSGDPVVKIEVFPDHLEQEHAHRKYQLELFD